MQGIIFAIRVQLTYNYAGIEIVDSDQDNEKIEDDDEYIKEIVKMMKHQQIFQLE